MGAFRTRQERPSVEPLPDTWEGSHCPSCSGGATPDRPPTLMGGTGIVEVQRWRCDRDDSHWWDEFRPIVDLPSNELGGRRSPELLRIGVMNLPAPGATAPSRPTRREVPATRRWRSSDQGRHGSFDPTARM